MQIYQRKTIMLKPVIKTNFLSLSDELKKLSLPKHRVCIVGDSNTMPLYGDAVVEECEKVFSEVHTFVWPAGEEQKNLDSIRELLKYLLEQHFDRKDCLIALGGGVTGDMTGFASAVYLRGIPVIQLPTTLLAQIDSSIGGKTGVDFYGYKNMVGAFHMPALVYSNISVLKTLPREQIISGMGEIVKSALLGDRDFYIWLQNNTDKIKEMDPETMRFMVERTSGIKVQIVERDPEEHGERALLNFGHTIGHAVEKYKNFELQHGVCVGLGIIAASYMSVRRGMISEDDLAGIRSMCTSFGLPVTTDGLNPEEILRITKSDKKMSNGQIRFILLESIGKACISEDVTDQEILDGIRYISDEGEESL